MLHVFVNAESIFRAVCLQVEERVAGSRGEALYVYEAGRCRVASSVTLKPHTEPMSTCVQVHMPLCDS